jgi:hypothetical protein
VRLVSAMVLSALVLISSSPAGAQSGSPQPTEPAAGSVAVASIGPDGLGSAPSPPIGPAWQAGFGRSFWNVGDIDLVACDAGFTLLGYVHEKLEGQRYRPRALVWTSPDGIAWSRGGALRPGGDPTEDDWAVFDLVMFRGDLLALGAEDRRLVVWRSGDCGQTWRRLRDRPLFFVGRKAIALSGVRAAATDDTLLVLGSQAGEWIPPRRWAWTLDDEHGWRRIGGGLDGVVDYGLVSDGRRFLANREVVVPGPRRAGRLITSRDGRRWAELGVLPDRHRPVIPDPSRDRVFVQTDVVGSGWTSAELQASTDDETWTPVLRAAPMTQGSSGQLYEADGVLVWIIDIWDDTDTNAWSWIGVSEDGGATWTVSAGQPGMQLAGLQSVAATDDAIVLAFTGEGFDEIDVWTIPRGAVPAAPTIEPGASVGIADLWGPFDPDDLIVSYTCAPPVTFTATELATAPGPDEVSPPINIGSLVDPDDAVGLTDWRIVADDGERAYAVAGRDDPALASSMPLHYLRLERTDTGWRWEGSGDCAPQARFPETYANGGFWRLDERRPPPGPDARAIHVKVWGHRDCRTSVELRGEPVVVMTDDAVLLTIPVADVSSSDMCTPGPPGRITARLPEPLGERELYDVGVLPPRRVTP